MKGNSVCLPAAPVLSPYNLTNAHYSLSRTPPRDPPKADKSPLRCDRHLVSGIWPLASDNRYLFPPPVPFLLIAGTSS